MSFNPSDLDRTDVFKAFVLAIVCGLILRAFMPEIYNAIMGYGSGILPDTITHVEAFTDFAGGVGGPVASESLMDGQAVPQSVENMGRTASSCYPQTSLTSEDLLPKDDSTAIKEFNVTQPAGEGVLNGVNLLDAGFHVGVNTVGQSLRNANLQLRSEPPNPQVQVSPFLNSSIGPDLMRIPLETGGCGVDSSVPTEIPGLGSSESAPAQ